MKTIKVLVVIVVLVVAGWSGATYFVGSKVEQEYRSFIAQNGQWGPFSLSVSKYRRGFLSSRAQTLLEMTVPKPPAEPGGEPGFETEQLIFEHTIFHGPLPVGDPHAAFRPALALIDTGLRLPATGDEAYRRMLRDIPELSDSYSHVRIGFTRRTDGRIEVPPFARQVETDSIAWGGLTATAVYNPGDGTLVGMVDMPNLEARFDDGFMRWHRLDADFDMVEVLPGLFVGQSRTDFGGMEAEFNDPVSGQPKSVQLQQISMVSDSSFDGSMVDASQVMSLTGVTVNNEMYGPFEIDMEVRNMDGRALSDYQQNIMNLYREVDMLNPDAMVAQMIPIYSDLAMRLLAGSPEFDIRRFYVNTPMGAASGSLQASYAHPQKQAPASLAMIGQYLPFFRANADLTVDAGLLKRFLRQSVRSQLDAAIAGGRQPDMSELEKEAIVTQQIEKQLQTFAAQGFIRREGEKVMSQVSFADGRLLVNGQPLPVGGR